MASLSHSPLSLRLTKRISYLPPRSEILSARSGRWRADSSLGLRKLGLGFRVSASKDVLDAIEKEEVVEERAFKVGIVCGGPSAERGISLNSARSVLDHIQGDDLHVSCYYIDCDLNAYAISPAQLYSNTPADFDFKLESLAQGFHSLTEFAEHLACSVDIVFPVIHGHFGEDGSIQELLEKANVPFVGTTSGECRQAFDKYNASIELFRQGVVTVPSFLIEVQQQTASLWNQENQAINSELSEWFESNQLDKDTGKVVVCKGWI